MLLRSPYLARAEALRQLTNSLDDSSMQLLLRTYEEGSPYWKKRVWEGWAYLWDVETIQKILPLAQKEIESPEVKVRAAAWEWLASMLNPFEEMGSLLVGDSSQAVPAALEPTYWTEAAQKALQDSSAAVIQAALQVLEMGDKARAQEAALSLLTHPSEEIFLAASMVLIRQKSPVGLQALLARQPCLASLEARASAISLLTMSTRSFPSEREKIVASLQQIARYENPWYLRLMAVRGLRRLAATDQTIRSFLRELKKSERHPILKKVYEREL